MYICCVPYFNIYKFHKRLLKLYLCVTVMSLSSMLTNLSQSSLLCIRVIFLAIALCFYILYSITLLYFVNNFCSFLFFSLSIALCISSFQVLNHFRFFHFVYRMLSSAALVMASLIFNQSFPISPLGGVSLPLNLFLYKVLIDSSSYKCTLDV